MTDAKVEAKPAPKAAAKAAAAPVSAAEKAEKKLAKAKAKKSTAKKNVAKKPAKKFTIDCSEPVEDDIFDIASFEKFLHDRIKVAGKTGVLGDSVAIAREGNQVHVTAKIDFSKRYLKYLTKKFLKKQLLRDYIRVIARTKTGYFLRYFNLHNEEEGAESAAAAE